MKAILIITTAMFISGCSGANIWNSGDLEKWVRSEAVKSGCEEQSVKLADWYVNEDGKNNWKGSCNNAESGAATIISINVDKVWKPSESN